jgi:nicotinate-nucleotide pyrophosphorylase (carboxylating)
MLDNMSVEQCREAVAIVNGKTKLEASGGLSLNNANAYAQTGVDFIAVGALTHSAKALDIGLDLRMGS